MRLTIQFFNCTRTGLIRLAALVWLTGVVVLWVKSSGMLVEAMAIGAGWPGVATAVITGLTAGAVKGKYLFVRLCKANLKRIASLPTPKIWQCYRIRFFFFLALMITLGRWAHGMFQNNPVLLLCLAALELSVGTALFISATCFFKRSQS